MTWHCDSILDLLVFTRDLTNKIRARVMSLGLVCNQGHFSWLLTAGPTWHCHPPPVPHSPSGNQRLLAGGKTERLAIPAHSPALLPAMGHPLCGVGALAWHHPCLPPPTPGSLFPIRQFEPASPGKGPRSCLAGPDQAIGACGQGTAPALSGQYVS